MSAYSTLKTERRWEDAADLSSSGGPSAKLRVENIHYDLGKADLDVSAFLSGPAPQALIHLQDLFNRIGPVSRLELLYDRAGRSEGVAYVTYESAHDAATAIREFDGANANGQPIRLLPVHDGPSRRRNPFDSAVQPPRSLEDRISFAPSSRDRSYSPRPSNVRGPPPPNVDRYVPGDRSSRSPRPRRREGRPPGARRERGERLERGRGGREAGARPERRPKKTQEELDAEMDDYWGASKTNGGDSAAAAAAETVAAAPISQDVEMAE